MEVGTPNIIYKSNRRGAGEMYITGLKGNTRYQVGIEIEIGNIELSTPNDRFVTTLMADLTVRGVARLGWRERFDGALEFIQRPCVLYSVLEESRPVVRGEPGDKWR